MRKQKKRQNDYPEKTPNTLERLGFVFLIVLVLCLLWWFFFTPSSSWVERVYSQGFYAWLSSWWVPLSNAASFSWAALLLSVLPVAYLLMVFLSFRRNIFWKGLFLVFSRTLASFIIIAAWFVVTWGANYQRDSIETQMNLQTNAATETDLEQLLKTLTIIIQETVTAERNEQEATEAIRISLEETVETLTGIRPTIPNNVKRLPNGSLILLGRASGIMSPWTLEPHIDGALPSLSYVAIGAHELAHVAGYAGEADADLISAIAGLNAQNEFANYAVALRFWQSAIWQLPQAKQASFRDQLPEQAKKDLEAMNAPYRNYQLPQFVQRIQQQSYDRYLKTQGVSSGIQDYSRAIDLLIKAQKQGLVLNP